MGQQRVPGKKDPRDGVFLIGVQGYVRRKGREGQKRAVKDPAAHAAELIFKNDLQPFLPFFVLPDPVPEFGDQLLLFFERQHGFTLIQNTLFAGGVRQADHLVRHGDRLHIERFFKDIQRLHPLCTVGLFVGHTVTAPRFVRDLPRPGNGIVDDGVCVDLTPA